MTIVDCPQCKTALKAGPKDSGKSFRCPKCGKVFRASTDALSTAHSAPPGSPQRFETQNASEDRVIAILLLTMCLFFAIGGVYISIMLDGKIGSFMGMGSVLCGAISAYYWWESSNPTLLVADARTVRVTDKHGNIKYQVPYRIIDSFDFSWEEVKRFRGGDSSGLLIAMFLNAMFPGKMVPTGIIIRITDEDDPGLVWPNLPDNISRLIVSGPWNATYEEVLAALRQFERNPSVPQSFGVPSPDSRSNDDNPFNFA